MPPVPPHSPPSATRGRRTALAGRDGGITLVEVLVTVAVLAIVIVPVMNALIGSVWMSHRSMEAAEVQTVLQNAADRVNRAPVSACYQTYVQAAALSTWGADGASTFTVSEHRYVRDQGSGSMEWEPSTCSSPLPAPGTVQSVVITITGPGTGVSRSIEVVKSGL